MSFYRSILTVGGLTLGSRILGFMRDMMTASFLGAGIISDCWIVALKLPNFFRRITAEGAFSVSFVPLFAGELEKNGKEEAKKFAEEAQAVMLSVLIPFTIVCIAAMPWILYLIAPGFDSTPERYRLALEMSRVTFPYLLLMSLTSLLGGVMNSFGKFGAFAAAPMLFNLSLMFGLYFFTPHMETGGHALSWGVALAGITQFAWLFYSCWKIKFILKLRRPRITQHIRKLFKKMLPGVFGAGIAQINIFVDMILASLLPVGAMSYLYYADRLYQLPLSVIGTAIGTALLPMMARAIKSGEPLAANRLFTNAFQISLLLSLPCMATYIVTADPIMQVLFEHGKFTAKDSIASAHALMGYSIGLPAFILAKVFASSFYAREDTSTPVKFAVVCAVLNSLTALTLIYVFPMGHTGIALATGLTAWVNVGLLAHGLYKIKVLAFDKHSIKEALFIVASTLIMAGALLAGNNYILPHFMTGDHMSSIIGLTLTLSAAGMVYGASLYFLGVLHPERIKNLFPKRKKQDTIGDVQRYGQ